MKFLLILAFTMCTMAVTPRFEEQYQFKMVTDQYSGKVFPVAVPQTRFPQSSGDLLEIMKLQALQNMQFQQQFQQQYLQNFQQNLIGMNRNQAGRTRRATRGVRNFFTKGKVNNGLLGIGVANEFLNKDSRYGDKNKIRMGTGGAYLLNNILR